MIWCSIVFFSIGARAFWTITKQDKSIYDSWEDDESFHDEVGQCDILGKLKNNIAQNDTLYLIVIKEVWDRYSMSNENRPES